MKQINKDCNQFMTDEKELKKLGYYEVLVKATYLKGEQKPEYKINDFLDIGGGVYCEIKSSKLIGKEIKGEVRVFRKD